MRGADGFAHRNWMEGSTSRWERLLLPLSTAAPVAIANRVSVLDVFGRALDDSLFHTWWNGQPGGWSHGALPGPAIASDPALVSWGSGRLDLFALARGDLALTHWAWDGTRWQVERVGGALGIGPPAAATVRSGQLDVFVRGWDNDLWHLWRNGTGGWNGGKPAFAQGRTMRGYPTAVAGEDGRLDVFYNWRGTVQHLVKVGGGDWDSNLLILPGDRKAVGSPTAAWAGNTLVVAVRGPDGDLWTWSSGGDDWAEAISHGGTITSAPATIDGFNILVRAAWDGTLWEHGLEWENRFGYLR